MTTMTMAGERLLTVNEIAEWLDLAPSTLYAYLTRGQMPEPDARYGVTNLWKESTIREWRGMNSDQG